MVEVRNEDGQSVLGLRLVADTRHCPTSPV